MKFSLLLLAAGLFTISAASAQTTAPASPGTATPSTVPSGMPPQPADPNGAVTPGQVFTKGAPQDNMSDKNTDRKHMKMRKHDKTTMSDDKTKMKAKSSDY